MVITDLLEALMIISFGLSWPVSIYKSYTSRTAKGKSAMFEIIIWIGYVFGIARKVIQLNQMTAAGKSPEFLFWFAWFFYVVNMVLITVDLVLYVRNRKLDEARARDEILND